MRSPPSVERPMTRYFLHLRDSVDELLDPEGQEYADLEALKKAVMFGARDLICGDLRNGVIDLRYRIDAENEHGELVYTLPFKHAFSVIPES
jgi:hypothetical protein